ncbi:MAG TPA: hypothetical protein ENK20_10310 [Chromatiales bacterium]|nr:hypothetical protein [Chromatiales bacterium]
MKTTLDIPDGLYRRIKAAASRRRRSLRALTIELYRRWLAEQPALPGSARKGSRRDWLERWMRQGRAACRGAGAGPSAREIVHRDRGRLEGNDRRARR